MYQKQLLTNVVIIRLILIILLVFYHAFAIFSGAWAPIDGYPDLHIYWWMDKLSYAFLLEMFVFISGYVFGYQVKTKGEAKLRAKNLLYSKFKRLIIPSMFFSLLYIILLKDFKQPLHRTIYDIFNGVAHMWFLPMLYWCFVGIWVIEFLKLKTTIILPLLILISICSFIKIPLQINNAMYYMLFFYIGYYLQRNSINYERFYTKYNVILLFAAFLFLFSSMTFLCSNLNNIFDGLITDNLILKVLKRVIITISKLVYSTTGLSALFVAVGCVDKRLSSQLPHWVVWVGELSMGIYIFQQFILKGLYNYTLLPSMFSPILMPWLGFVIALCLSLMLSFYFRKTSVGRFLIC